jgi:hypothetical protein
MFLLLLTLQVFTTAPLGDPFAFFRPTELSEIVTCRPSRCGLKLSAAEMAELQHAAAEAGIDWKSRLQEQFRRTVLDRVYDYLEGRQVGPYEDHAGQVWPADEFDKLVERSEFLTAHEPEFAAYLRGASTKPMSMRRLA